MNLKSLPYLILKNPLVYWTYQRIVGGDSARAAFIKEFVKPQPNAKVLDIGCGPGNILDFLPKLDYYGFDINADYIKAAEKNYYDRGTFICATVNEFIASEHKNFDLALSVGVLHHLDDDEAKQVFAIASKTLKPGGKLITFDGCYRPKQNKLARLFLKLDRGKFVRTQEQYLKLAEGYFESISSTLDEDSFNIPYTSLIMECVNS
ncbi:class I SAM-dependent methyltransferase [Ichthyenterobacterium sp. W332]|uniref:Class I SAM-dependent methyltransferase n=1 Tax=Microcosmobacter mediterraneus TaxID=3075607 RepID=A0ABU2YM58_9FLAO|nr:class I SAM-dependent methyltransferase [Ichthyenterobacterium sp. W332]MDT0559249.1 class I SAM-dependent methyltransferase [Ichthyenterobacterium sp. W332]